MPSLLILNTALARSCAVVVGDGEPVARHAPHSRQSAQTILQLARQALDGAGLRRADAVAVVNGPGSFTGTRIGVAAAQGLCAAWDAPALPISTLALMATAARRSRPAADTFLAAIRARGDEIYFGCYRRTGGGLIVHGNEQAGPLEQLCISPEDVDVAPDSGENFTETGAPGSAQAAAAQLGAVVAAGDCWPEAAAIEAHFGFALQGEAFAVTVEVADLVEIARAARQREQCVGADLLRPNYVSATPQYREHSAGKP